MQWQGNAAVVSSHIPPIILYQRLAYLLILPRVHVAFAATIIPTHASVGDEFKNVSIIFSYTPKRPRLCPCARTSHSRNRDPYQHFIKFNSSNSKKIQRNQQGQCSGIPHCILDMTSLRSETPKSTPYPCAPPSHSEQPHPYRYLIHLSSSSGYFHLAIAVAADVQFSPLQHVSLPPCCKIQSTPTISPYNPPSATRYCPLL